MTESRWFGMVVVGAALALTAAGRLSAQPAGAPAPERIALVNANVVNVVTGTVHDGQTLVLSVLHRTGDHVHHVGVDERDPLRRGCARRLCRQPCRGGQRERRTGHHHAEPSARDHRRS